MNVMLLRKFIAFLFNFSSFLIVVLILLILYSGCSNIRNDKDFIIEGRAEINFFGIYGSDTAELSRQDSEWVLNGNLKPDPVAVENFFYAFEHIEIAGATTGQVQDSMISRKIVLKGKNKPRLYRFYSSQNYYLLHHEGSPRIYRIKIRSAPDANSKQRIAFCVPRLTNR